ncbi:Chitin Synthase Regulator [Pleurotus pulmonarius]|nr:hypothetical protein EYR36_000473 [Pleurotus pulmonarius]
MSEASNRSQHSLPPESQYQQQQQPQYDPRSRRQGAPADPNWQPALSSIPDDGDLFDEAAYGLGPPPSQPNAIMQHPNRSVPSLPSHQNQNRGHDPNAPPVPQYDPTAVLDQFGAMRISDPTGQESRYPPHPGDPIPRAASSMSARAPQHQQHSYGHLRHANTLPPGPNYGQSQGPPQAYDRQWANAGDPSMYPPPQHAEGFPPNGQYAAYDRGPEGTYQADPAYQSYGSPELAYDQPPYNYHPQHMQPPQQQSWQGQPPQVDYNIYAAASDVLGMAPPPGPPAVPPAYDPSYSTRSSYAASSISLPSSHSSQQGPGPYGPPSVHSHNEPEIAPRPSLERSGTSASVNLRTSKTKAVDLSAPPYTKEYIDQYRQRIKADPDPEAHFLYAKYLIDAARKIRADHKDQRAAKKYTELLITESLKVVRKLATQGEAYDEAQFFLANCYGTGALGLQVDHERAYHLYLQAAKQNHAAACYRVAVCNEIGAGTRKEPPRAAAFYRKAASLGDTPAMYKLGMILLNGTLGEAKNPREAINWLKRAAEQADEDNPHALHELGILHEQGDNQLVISDPAYARQLFTQAAHLGYTPSQFKLGQCYEYGSLTCPMDPRRSIAWYTKAAEKGDAEAELALSGWYLTGSEGVLKQSDSEAYLWARRAANKGLSKAEYAVGYYAEVGIGIKQDIEFAKRWYMRAAAQGNKRAMNRLTEIKRMGNKRINVARPTRQQAKDECVIC